MVKRIEEILSSNNAFGATFYEIGQHSPIAGIRKGAQLFKEHGCDVIVAVGGGSPVDASKAILYYIQKEVGGKTPPQIAIPTTLSAAEWSVREIMTIMHKTFALIMSTDRCWLYQR